MIFFKIGCYVLIATCCFHLVGHFQKPVAQNDTQRQLLELMPTPIDTGVGIISMEGIQKGFSLCFSLLFLWSGVLSLFLSYKFSNDFSMLRKVSLINTSALVLGTGISLIYFFAIPTACFALSLVFFTISIFRLNNPKKVVIH